MQLHIYLNYMMRERKYGQEKLQSSRILPVLGFFRLKKQLQHQFRLDAHLNQHSTSDLGHLKFGLKLDQSHRIRAFG